MKERIEAMNKFNFKPAKNQNLIIGFIIAALIVLFVVLFAANRDEPRYELTIKELGGSSMLALSDAKELGVGEILLVYGDDMVVQDVNGQIIDLIDLDVEDKISVSLAPHEKVPKDGVLADPVIGAITLLAVGSNEYI